MISTIFLVYAIGHLALFVGAMRLFLRHRHPSTVPLLIVTFGLVYDNGILAAGQVIGHGATLENLSVPRYFMHAFGTPLLMLSALGLLVRSGLAIAKRPPIAAILASLTIAMIAIGVDADLVRLVLQAKQAGDLISYGNGGKSGPPIAPIVTIFVLIGAGFLLWRRGAGAWLLIGSLVQFVAAALGDRVAWGGNLGELALLASLVATDWRLSENAGRPQLE